MWYDFEPVGLKKKSHKKLADLSGSEFFIFPAEVPEDFGQNLMDKNCLYDGHHRKVLLVYDFRHLSDSFNGSDTVASLSLTIGTPREISTSKWRHY